MLRTTKNCRFFALFLTLVPGGDYNEEVGFTDGGLMFPDLDTVINMPWCKNTGRVLIEPTYQGKPVLAHPRILARKQLARLKELGFTLLNPPTTMNSLWLTKTL